MPLEKVCWHFEVKRAGKSFSHDHGEFRLLDGGRVIFDNLTLGTVWVEWESEGSQSRRFDPTGLWHTMST